MNLTNATKAHVIAVVNAALGVVAAFGYLSAEQIGAITLAVNAVLAAYVAVTYKASPKRKP